MQMGRTRPAVRRDELGRSRLAMSWSRSRRRTLCRQRINHAARKRGEYERIRRREICTIRTRRGRKVVTQFARERFIIVRNLAARLISPRYRTCRKPWRTVLRAHVDDDCRVEGERVFVRVKRPLDVLDAVVPVDDASFARQTHVERPRRGSSHRPITARVRVALGIDRKESDEVTRTIRIVRLVKTSSQPKTRCRNHDDPRTASRKREHRIDGGALKKRRENKRQTKQKRAGGHILRPVRPKPEVWSVRR